MLRTNVDKISLIGRNTQGVAIMNVGEGDQVSAIAAITLTNAAGQRNQRQVPGSTNGQTPPAGDEGDGDTDTEA